MYTHGGYNVGFWKHLFAKLGTNQYLLFFINQHEFIYLSLSQPTHPHALAQETNHHNQLHPINHCSFILITRQWFWHSSNIFIITNFEISTNLFLSITFYKCWCQCVPRDCKLLFLKLSSVELFISIHHQVDKWSI